MWNDMQFQINLLNKFDNDEIKAFRWLFTPYPQLNHRTPMEVLSDGGIARIIQVLEEYNG